MSAIFRIRANLESLGGLHFSQRVLLALTQAGMSREQAYKLVQSNAMRVWADLQKGKPANFPARIKADKTIRKYLKPKVLAGCFDLKPYIRHAKMIWQRIIKEYRI